MNQNLWSTVIENDYCIGCGACNFVNPDYKIEMDKYGMYKASIEDSLSKPNDLASQVCPFSNDSKNEDELAESLYPNASSKNTYFGKYIKNYVGFVEEGQFREKGSSGGFGKWILHELLQKGHVDYVVQLVSNNEQDNLFKFEVFTKDDDILKGSKSAYYPVTMKGVLNFIKENEGRYAITAIPCFSKAIRNICAKDEVIASRIKFVIGIICGHLKSTGFAESLGWQLEVNPKMLRGIEFRDKIEGLKANEKGVYAIDKENGKTDLMSSKTMFGGDWGHGFFKYKACDYCDDIVGETTDVSVGDAWIEALMSDHRGNNVLIIRNQLVGELIEQAITENRLNLKEVDEEVVVHSQSGGIRHRREGLSYRLAEKNKANRWVPNKRVQASSSISDERKKIYKVREELRDASHELFLIAKQADDFKVFEKPMKKLVKQLHKSFAVKVMKRLKGIYSSIFDLKK